MLLQLNMLEVQKSTGDQEEAVKKKNLFLIFFNISIFFLDTPSEGHIKTPTPSNRLPDASQGANHLRDIFYRMGFNDQEIVALAGAHALGRCHTDRSGFSGKKKK